MANGKVVTGYSFPKVAPLDAAATTDVLALGRGTQVEYNITTAADNIFYADNAAAENSGGVFQSGTITLTSDTPKRNTKDMIFGLPEGENVTIAQQQYVLHSENDGRNTPYVKVGYIVEYTESGVKSYSVVAHNKVKFNQTNEGAQTRGETVNYQTINLTANIFRDDNGDWKHIIDDIESETTAETVLINLLAGLVTPTPESP